MTRLIEASVADVRLGAENDGLIARELAATGARLDRRRATRALPPGETPHEIHAAHTPEIERLRRERGGARADVVSYDTLHGGVDRNWTSR